MRMHACTSTIFTRRKGHDTTSSVTNTSPYEKVKKTTSHTTEMDTIDTGKIEEAQYATISGEPARQGNTITQHWTLSYPPSLLSISLLIPPTPLPPSPPPSHTFSHSSSFH